MTVFLCHPVCIYLHSVVIPKTGSKPNLWRNQLIYSLQHRKIDLYSWIASESQFFKGVLYLIQIIVIKGAPLE